MKSEFSFVILLLIVAFFTGTAFAGSAAINCQAHEGTCSQPLGKETVALEITPRPVEGHQRPGAFGEFICNVGD